ncbi:MAG: helix-turn-helix domain-containing protein [Bacteroidetes bacterium]|nr:helix-turn-helix domain-containing protein [Bacteroidota bacterium]
MLPDPHNNVFQLAVQFINQTSKPVFLTGKAGTGKTTFLKYIRENSFKKMAVVAPTGVAAINAGGTTMHSFFQLPFGPFLPVPRYGWNEDAPNFTDPNSLFKNIRFNASKRELLQELELLIIDEISMVRADMLDAVDFILRHFRQQPLQPFGGLQVLYIGDLFQLPPVVSNSEWEILQEHYPSRFFFDSKVVRAQQPVYLELEKIYRQNETQFIDILNKVRTNRITPDHLERLNDYYQPDFIPSKHDNYITLTSHNHKADSINQEQLSRLPGRSHSFEASITGEFSEKSLPAERTLTLKEGAQVMLIKNDKGEVRRYFNGKIGTIKSIKEDKLTLVFPDEPDELTLEKETWRNIRYQYNKDDDKVEEEELGTFRQYPIRLAWAITIHKSQGLTFEKAVIDAGESFAAGQVYVALSRLTSLNGLVLRSRITPSSIRTDRDIARYTDEQAPPLMAAEWIGLSQIEFIGDSLRKAFQWSRLVEQLQNHFQGYGTRQIPSKHIAIAEASRWLKSAVAQQEVAEKFARQLEQILPGAENDRYAQLAQRTTAAAGYFSRILEDQVLAPLTQHIAEIRASKKAKKYLEDLMTLKRVCARKKQQVDDAIKMVAGLQQGIETTKLLDSIQEERQNKKNAEEAQESAVSVKPSGKAQKGDTNRATLQLYKEGIAITDIASRRNLTVTTIEGHLASFIPTGEIDVKELVPEHKIEPILSAIRTLGAGALGPLKSQLGSDYSFGEIRAVLTWSRTLPAAT